MCFVVISVNTKKNRSKKILIGTMLQHFLVCISIKFVLNTYSIEMYKYICIYI